MRFAWFLNFFCYFHQAINNQSRDWKEILLVFKTFLLLSCRLKTTHLEHGKNIAYFLKLCCYFHQAINNPSRSWNEILLVFKTFFVTFKGNKE